MKTDDISPVHLAIIGKTSEELGELLAAQNRCLIQGLDEKDPDTNQINREWLEEEIADVHAMLKLMVEKFELNLLAIEFRIDLKYRYKKSWLDRLEPLVRAKE